MKNIISKSLILVLIAFLFLMTGCAIIDNNLANDDIIKPEISKNKEKPTGNYNKDKILVKYGEELTNDLLGSLEYLSFERLYKGSKWYLINLKETIEATDAYSYLNDLNIFEAIDYDYIMQSDGEVLSTDISSNTYAEDLSYLETLGVKKGWEHNANNKKYPGGTSDVVIAIIDTGVDYNHLDLIDNIWVNTAEIPNNGIDDDNNGYIDDINGWNCVGDNNDPMDDNGHGTHVAGIAAASNNKMGTVGIAYNCKIMCLKAGSSSGYFSSSDIAEAVEYAYMNGASVINMSFGGIEISRFTEEALENAYNQCVLVAAAGNSGMCNQPDCSVCYPNVAPFYPASLTYVIGVMSCDSSGQCMSGFSNYDHYLFNSYEYDIYSCGENIVSTWPNNKYASLSGTSMASPTVAGIAAVLRSTFSDRELYSNKFITSQIVRSHNTDSYGVANLYNALTNIPKPFVYGINDYYIFDNVEFSDKNNGNGVIDAGETIRLAVELINRGGVATNVVATIDTIRNDDASITDKYFTITKDTVEMSDIGTYSTRDFGKIYDSNGNLIGTEKYFEFIVSEDCPNSYLSDFNLNLTYNNGLDEKDKEIYTGIGVLSCMVNRGYHLPSIITEDTTFTNNTLYIVSNNVVIPEGVTVNFEEGCQIQFYDNREYFNSPRIKVYGELNFNGSKENMIDIFPENLMHEDFVCYIDNYGKINFDYVSMINVASEQFDINGIFACGDVEYTCNLSNSYMRFFYSKSNCAIKSYRSGLIDSSYGKTINLGSVDNCYIEFVSNVNFEIYNIKNSYINHMLTGGIDVLLYNAYNNVFYFQRIWFYETNNISPNELHFLNNLKNNKFITPANCTVYDFPDIRILNDTMGKFCICENNEFSNDFKDNITSIIKDYTDELGNPRLDINDTCSDISKVYPHILKYEIFDKDGNKVNKIGTEEVTFRITFNQDMDTTKDVKVYFGSVLPYSDYEVEGKFISPTVWEGKYKLKAYIENGLNYLHVENACAASDPTLKVYGDYQLYEFDIDTTTALSMNIQAKPTDTGIELNWIQDDYDTLMGYNVYRSEEKDGNYVRINPYIIPGDELTFFDDNAEPGKTYWYTFTVVLSDFTESNPAGKIVTTAKDTIVPNVYHTPVNQGYLNNNLVISCTASDNIAIAKVMLYYRTKGAEAWKSLQMLKQNDKYSGTIFGNEISLEGLEYYIIAYDSQNAINKGTEENPYSVIIKDASSIIRLGDVDGDGTLTTKDALMIIKSINGDLLLTDDEFKRADLNKDNVLSSVEALRILQFINGNVNSLEME